MFVWQAHEGAVTSLCFGPGGRFLLSAGDDGRVKGWEPFTGAEQFCISLRDTSTLFYAPQPLHLLTPSADGARAVVHAAGRGLAFLDLASERLTDSRPLAWVYSLKRTPDGESVVVLWPGESNSAMPVIWRFDFADAVSANLGLSGYGYAARALAFSPDGTRLGVGRQNFAWPPVPNGRVGSVYTKSYEPEALAFSADEHLFALVGGKVAVYSLSSSLFRTKLKGHTGKITAMELAPDGRRLWTASRDATVKCWDTHSLSLDRTFRFDTGGLDCLAVSPDGNVAAVGSGQKGTVTVWDLN